MSELVVNMTGVSKVFETEEMETHALHKIDLKIFEREFVSISGPSGSGKSTLLSILGLLDVPTCGQYFIGPSDVSRLTLKEAAYFRNEKIGFIFQSFNLIDELSVFENIALPLKYRRERISNSEINERVMNGLERVNMGHRARHKPTQLSGGQQQRIAIARALIGSPALLLVDEPTGNLDSRSGDAVMEILSQLNSDGATICMVTHDSRYADVADRKLHLLDGKMQNMNELKFASAEEEVLV